MAIDYTTIMGRDEVFDDVAQLIDDLMSEEGQQVLCLGWDSEFPGGSGAIWVNEWRGMFFAQSSDYDPEGPFDSLDAVLDSEPFHTVTSNPELDSETLSEEQLKGIALALVGEDGDTIWINSQEFVLKDGELVAAD